MRTLRIISERARRQTNTEQTVAWMTISTHMFQARFAYVCVQIPSDMRAPNVYVNLSYACFETADRPRARIVVRHNWHGRTGEARVEECVYHNGTIITIPDNKWSHAGLSHAAASLPIPAVVIIAALLLATAVRVRVKLIGHTRNNM